MTLNVLSKSKTAANLDRSRIGSIKLDGSINSENEKGMFYIKPINKSIMTYSNKAYLNDMNDDFAEELNVKNQKNSSDAKVIKKSLFVLTRGPISLLPSLTVVQLLINP